MDEDEEDEDEDEETTGNCSLEETGDDVIGVVVPGVEDMASFSSFAGLLQFPMAVSRGAPGAPNHMYGYHVF